jgi:hypothetical protein
MTAMLNVAFCPSATGRPRRTSDLPSEFTKTVRNDPLLEQFSLLVLWPKDRSFFGPRVSHFLKGEPKIGISEDKGTNRGHPHEQIALANTVI